MRSFSFFFLFLVKIIADYVIKLRDISQRSLLSGSRCRGVIRRLQWRLPLSSESVDSARGRAGMSGPRSLFAISAPWNLKVGCVLGPDSLIQEGIYCARKNQSDPFIVTIFATIHTRGLCSFFLFLICLSRIHTRAQ